MYDGEGWSKNGEVIAKEAAFHSKTEVNLESTDSNELFSKMIETVLKSLAKFQRQWTNWRFHSVLSQDLHTVKYVPLGDSSYIPLSTFFAAKKAFINLKNEDDEFFKWAIPRALNPVEITLDVLIKTSRNINGSQFGGPEISRQFERYQKIWKS